MGQVTVIVVWGRVTGRVQFPDLGAALAFVLVWHNSPWRRLGELSRRILGDELAESVGKALQ